MKRLFLFYLYFTLCMVATQANPVTQTQALQKAKAFLLTKGLEVNAEMNMVYQGRKTSHQHEALAKNAYYYVFNNGSNGGFVIVAGDDCAEEVLGYAEHGTFNAENIPENLQALLNDYAAQIAWAQANHIVTAQSGSDEDVAYQVIAPLVKSHWNQYKPYDLKCPLYGPGGESGDQCITGCVATAMSQVMYYHKWPKAATTTVPEYSSNAVIGTLGELPSVVFDWDNMSDCYSNNLNESKERKDAVATLNRYCGQSVLMDYSPYGSAGYTSMIPMALSTYFGYQNKASWINRDDYTTEQWRDLIYNELRHARPVIYNADTSSGSGHAFICDGYDGHQLFHINWGWGGLSDGYYRLQALYPSSQGAGGNDGGGYSMDQSAIIGISPTVVSDKVQNDDTAGIETMDIQFVDPYASWGKIDDEQSFAYNANEGFANIYIKYVYRQVALSQGYDVAIGLFKGSDLLEKKDVRSNYNGSSSMQTWNAFSIGFGKNLDDGTYQIKGIDCITGTEEWVPSVSSDKRYVEVVVADGQCTLSIVRKAEAPDIVVTSVEQIISQSGGPQIIRVHLHNSGNKEYIGNLYLFVGNTNVGLETAYVPINGDDYVDYVCSISPNTYSLAVSENEDGSHPLYSNDSFVITDAASAPNLSVVKSELRNVDGSNQYGRQVELLLTLKNNSAVDFDGMLQKQMWVETPDSYFSGYGQDVHVSIPAGKEVTVPFTHDLALGDIYWIIIQQGSNELYEKYGIKVLPAFVSWTADGTRTATAVSTNVSVPETAVAASFEDFGDLSGTTITPNSNSNTLYYIAHGVTAPSSLNGKNVVQGYEANTITLTEASGFYIPQSFTASTISYSRTPTVGADGKKGWQTITLPFGVQEVTSDGKAVDWYHGNDTEEKDFWVREFTKVDGNVVKFADLDTWMPNTPYIIAVPGDHWGPQYDMTGKVLKFSASNAKVIQSPVCQMTSNAYDFIGTTSEREVSNAYVLNANGNSFELKANATVKASEAYFVANLTDGAAPANLSIGFDDLTGICMPRIMALEGQQVNVYSVGGVRVATVRVTDGKIDIDFLPKGIYIVEGKKIVK